MPLYQLFWSGTTREIAFAVLHCTGGDLLIAASSLLTALVLIGKRSWPEPSAETRRVAVAAVMIGIAYTVFSEWWNIAVRATWSYTEAMPVVPPFGTGLAPLLQWLIIPTLALWHTTRRCRANMVKRLQARPEGT